MNEDKLLKFLNEVTVSVCVYDTYILIQNNPTVKKCGPEEGHLTYVVKHPTGWLLTCVLRDIVNYF